MTSEETEDAGRGGGLNPEGGPTGWLCAGARGGRTLNSEEKTWKV